ncbi:MAG: hypothetical protein LBH57_05885 [Treponema sp.]|jgi:tetratricopeptide (TPR) repeat protein|nr:hypothetical protein [Treponema sp.]
MNEKRRAGRLKKFFLGVFFSAAFSLSAQITEIKDTFYHVVSDGGGADAAVVLRDLELRFRAYNRIFGFDPAVLGTPLKVRTFVDKADYDAYVRARTGGVQDGAVYMHYGRKENRELAIHRGSPGEAAALAHQSFVQFLRAFVDHPPAWMLEGFAVFFSSLRFVPEADALDYTENLAWLEQVKGLGNDAPSPEVILRAGGRDVPRHFQPLAWSVVSFFLNYAVPDADAPTHDAGLNYGRNIYSRILTEIFMILDPAAPAQVNTEAVMRRIGLRTDMETLRRDYRAYLAGRKTFAELIRDGRAAYARKDAAAAELGFREAGDLNPGHYAPSYYLGLLAYERGDYGAAEEFYRAAQEYGADPGLVNFARGLNAAAAGRTSDAGRFLEDAARASPSRFGRRAGDVMRRLTGE